MSKPRQHHVLIVDDQPAIVDITRRVLEYGGFSVTTFTSSIEALRSLREHPNRFDLVVADRDMPEVDGPELARQVWRMSVSLPVLFVSAIEDHVTFGTEGPIGRYEQLAKPYEADALVASVRALTAARTSNQYAHTAGASLSSNRGQQFGTDTSPRCDKGHGDGPAPR